MSQNHEVIQHISRLITYFYVGVFKTSLYKLIYIARLGLCEGNLCLNLKPMGYGSIK